MLRRMVVLDIVNNADRKGGHVLKMEGGHRHDIDHGVTFHAEHKLRTVLWGWVDDDLVPDEVAGVHRVRTALAGSLGEALTRLLSNAEIEALAVRCDRLLRREGFELSVSELSDKKDSSGQWSVVEMVWSVIDQVRPEGLSRSRSSCPHDRAPVRGRRKASPATSSILISSGARCDSSSRSHRAARQGCAPAK